MQDKQCFLDFLNGHGRSNVLFEPFISRVHTETLIWRRGSHLWDTPEAYVDTLVALSQRTRADIVFCDMRNYTPAENKRLIHTIEMYLDADGIGFGVICDQAGDLALAENSESVCTAAVYGNARSDSLPIIRMDGSLQDAIERGDSGWFARGDAEECLQKSNGRIRILGGLGEQKVLNSSPVEIYAEVERLAKVYPGQWSCGSGFEIPEENYLELISLLGAFGRIR